MIVERELHLTKNDIKETESLILELRKLDAMIRGVEGNLPSLEACIVLNTYRNCKIHMTRFIQTRYLSHYRKAAESLELLYDILSDYEEYILLTHSIRLIQRKLGSYLIKTNKMKGEFYEKKKQYSMPHKRGN